MTNKYSALPLIGRILIAVLFLLAGFGKVADPSGTIAYIGTAHLPFPQIAYAASTVIELAGALLLIAGYHTRFAAAVLAIFTLAAAAVFHNNFADQNQMIHFLKNISIAGGLLQVVAFGAGGVSLDARRSKV